MTTVTVATLLCLLLAEPPGSLKLAAVNVEPNDHRVLYVTLDQASNDAGAVLHADYWQVVLVTPKGARRAIVDGVAVSTCSSAGPLKRFGAECPAGEKIVEVALQLAAARPDDVTKITVAYAGPSGASSADADTPPALALGTKPDPDSQASERLRLTAAKKDDSDIYFDGSLARDFHGNSVYNIDTYAGYMRSVGGLGQLGAYGAAKTKDNARIDADSFLVYGVLQTVLGAGAMRHHVQDPYLNLRVAGLEFDRKGDQRNFVVSPVLTVPFRLFRDYDPIQPGLTTPRLTAQAGVEVVKPLKSALQPTHSWRARGLLGVTLATGWAPEVSWLQSIKASASYQVRLLSGDEVFKDPRHAPIDAATGKKGDPVFELGRSPRHHASAAVSYMPVKWAGISLKYEYGSLPPVFVITNHTVTFGVTLMLKQTSYGRYSILKP